MALAGFILLLVDTNAIFDVGFQLSFLAVLGIFWLNPALVRVLPKPKNNLQKFLISIITVSISAQLATLPLVLFYFHQYSILSVFANLIIVPFSEIIIVFSLLMTIVLGIGIELSWLNTVYELVVTFLLKTIHFFSEINWAFQENIPMSILEAGLLLVIIYFLRDILTKKSTKVILRFSFVFILFIGVRMLLNYYFQNTMEVIEIQNNKQKIILYKDQKKLWVFAKSTINEPKTIQFVIQPYLSNRRISEYSIKYIPDNYSQVMVNGKAYSLE
jgi:competence protein ComEC